MLKRKLDLINDESKKDPSIKTKNVNPMILSTYYHKSLEMMKAIDKDFNH